MGVGHEPEDDVDLEERGGESESSQSKLICRLGRLLESSLLGQLVFLIRRYCTCQCRDTFGNDFELVQDNVQIHSRQGVNCIGTMSCAYR